MDPGETLYHTVPIIDPDAVRLLNLHPSHSQDPLTGDLHTVSLADAPSYEAISYVWGEQTRCAKMTCNKQSIGLTQSLDYSLRRVRRGSHRRTLWVDQICIDQANPPERSQQITLMNKIYKNAKRILVCLGDDDTGIANNVFDLIRSLNTKFRDNERLDWLNDDQREQQLSWSDSNLWENLARFYQLPWFRRAWILQEIGTGAPAIVFWGDAYISWETLYNVSHFLEEKHHKFNKQYGLRPNNLTCLYRRFAEDDSSTDLDGKSFVYQQHRARHLKATDPRDHVFSLLGHHSTRVGTGALADLKADYTRPVANVFLDIAIRTLSGSPTLETLNAVQHGCHPNIHELPSWVSNWSQDQWAHMIGHPSSIFQASGGSLPKLVFMESQKSLKIEGLELDTVKRTSQVLNPSCFQFDNRSCASMVDLWRRICENTQFTLASRYVSGVSAIEAFLDTITVCCEKTKLGLGPSKRFADGLSYLARVLSHDPDVELSLELLELANAGDPFHWNRCTSVALNRRLARTASGYYILGPKVMKPKDIICVLFGGKTLFCLRPKDDYYLLVGECYVHGLMDGEAMDEMDHRQVPKKWFHIR